MYISTNKTTSLWLYVLLNFSSRYFPKLVGILEKDTIQDVCGTW